MADRSCPPLRWLAPLLVGLAACGDAPAAGRDTTAEAEASDTHAIEDEATPPPDSGAPADLGDASEGPDLPDLPGAPDGDLADGPDLADLADGAHGADLADEAESADVPPDAGPDTPAPGCLDGRPAGHATVDCGEITFELEVPSACLTSACGLIVDIHGWTMTADLEDANTDLRARAAALGYLVVQPTAPAVLGVPTWDLARHAEPIFAFLREVAATYGTDPRRAYAMGFSQGGALTWQLACRHADFFAAAAPIGALPGCAFDGADAPTRELDLLITHGRLDTVVAFSLYTSQRDAALAYWAFGPPTTLSEDSNHRALRYTAPSGSTLETWEHAYTGNLVLNGHCFPGSPQLIAFPQAFGCLQTAAFTWSDEVLAFFDRHRR